MDFQSARLYRLPKVTNVNNVDQSVGTKSFRRNDVVRTVQ